MSATAEDLRVAEPAAVADGAEQHLLDAEAFAALYARHRAALLRYIAARLADREQAEDLAQEVFAKAFAARARFDPSRPFWPWLLSIAARECIDVHRRGQYATSRLPEVARATHRQPFDLTSTTVLRALEERRLARGIEALPVRQRVALQLVAFDDWSYAEVAERLGWSVGVVKALVVRARRNLRKAGVGPLGALGGALHRRLRRMAAGFRPGYGPIGAPGNFAAMVTAHMGGHAPVVVVAVALLVAGTGGAVPPPASPSATVAAPSTAGSRVEERAGATAQDAGGPRRSPSAVGSAEHAVHELAAGVLSPDEEGMDPEGVSVGSFTASPDYEHDHTVFMTEQTGLDAPVFAAPLWISGDGGASWERRRALGLAPVARLLFPPDYPRDGRIFAVTSKGLQVTHDGGDSFETVFAVPGVQVSNVPNMTAAAISPRFAADNVVLLVAAGRLLELRVDTGAVRPVDLGLELATHQVTSVAFAADDPSGGTVLLGTALRRVENNNPGWHLSRCRADGVSLGGGPRFDCASTWFPVNTDADVPIRVPSGTVGSKVVFVAFDSQPYVSTDGGLNFRPAGPGFGGKDESRLLLDLVTLDTPGGESAVAAQTGGRWVQGRWQRGAPLSRTDDAGRTWTPLFVGLPRFEGSNAVLVTPTGRILAAGSGRGMACSLDGGRSWARLCPAPEGHSAVPGD